MQQLATHLRLRLPMLRAVLLLLTLALAAPASARRAHDQNLDDADNAIQKALALVAEVQSPAGPPRAVHRFERHLRSAERALEAARAQLQAAADLQDSITP